MDSFPTLPLDPTWCPVHGEGCECRPRIDAAADLANYFAVDEGDELAAMSELDWLEYLLASDEVPHE